MPTYEYRCPNGHRFEAVQKMSDEPVAACADCGEAAERVITGGGGFLLKGEGFYITDYRSDEYKEKAAQEKDASPKAEAKSESDASTPAATPDPKSDPVKESSGPPKDAKQSSDGES